VAQGLWGPCMGHPRSGPFACTVTVIVKRGDCAMIKAEEENQTLPGALTVQHCLLHWM
jgi:hypothetical protein